MQTFAQRLGNRVFEDKADKEDNGLTHFADFFEDNINNKNNKKKRRHFLQKECLCVLFVSLLFSSAFFDYYIVCKKSGRTKDVVVHVVYVVFKKDKHIALAHCLLCRRCLQKQTISKIK